MKYFFGILIISLLLSQGICAKTDTDPKALPRTEQGLIGKIINCLQYKDTNTYMTLFPDFDTVWKQVMTFHNDVNEEQQLSYIRQYPERVRQFDPYYNHAIVENFQYVVEKGEKEGIHWNQIVMSRFELRKEMLTRDMVGYNVIAPIRFRGYIFVKDMVTRRVYAFTVTEMHNIQGYWYGGQVINIFQAGDVEEYEQKLAQEMKRKRMMEEYGLTEADLDKQDSSKHKIQVDEDADNGDGDDAGDDDAKPVVNDGFAKKDIIDRKLFIGKFDNQIPVKLYIRYLRGKCLSGVCAWDAIYKFGDQAQYVKLDVTKRNDSTWEFVEDPPIGSMDLVQRGKVLTGSWETTDIQTGYDALLTEAELTPVEAQKLDDIIQRGLWSKDDKQDVQEKAAEKEKEKEEAAKRKLQPIEGADNVY